MRHFVPFCNREASTASSGASAASVGAGREWRRGRGKDRSGHDRRPGRRPRSSRRVAAAAGGARGGGPFTDVIGKMVFIG